MRKLKPSTIHILKGLLPYTRENLLLSFKPNEFFNELERLDRKQRHNEESIQASAYRQAYYRAQKSGFIELNEDGNPYVTDLGKRQLAIYEPETLPKALLLVTFDIEEELKSKRQEFRAILKMLKFTLVQRSVWISKYDSREILRDEITRLGIENDVIVYEAREIPTKTL